ncbi:hypothetical protein TrVFT333_011834 [Trichoderma virens FT-333]|nr:hypothetical protein TrVFT333_011834 [Trichoderma virens FT-333]
MSKRKFSSDPPLPRKKAKVAQHHVSLEFEACDTLTIPSPPSSQTTPTRLEKRKRTDHSHIDSRDEPSAKRARTSQSPSDTTSCPRSFSPEPWPSIGYVPEEEKEPNPLVEERYAGILYQVQYLRRATQAKMKRLSKRSFMPPIKRGILHQNPNRCYTSSRRNRCRPKSVPLEGEIEVLVSESKDASQCHLTKNSLGSSDARRKISITIGHEMKTLHRLLKDFCSQSDPPDETPSASYGI